MKRKIKLLALVLVLVLAVFSFASCKKRENTEEPAPAGASFTLVISGEVDTEYKVPLEKVTVTEGLISVLNYLEGVGALDYEMGASGMIESVGELSNDAASGKWIYIYTTVEEDIDVSEYATTVEYDGLTITSAGVGASSLKIVDGATVVIGLITYG